MKWEVFEQVGPTLYLVACCKWCVKPVVENTVLKGYKAKEFQRLVKH